MNQNFTEPAPDGPVGPRGKVVTDDTDEPEEDADEIQEDDIQEDYIDKDDKIKEPSLRRFFFGSTFIWLIGFVIVGIVVYRVMGDRKN